MSSSPDIPTRLWAVIRPDTDEVIGLRECHRGEQACATIASQLGLNCNAFFASWLPGSRQAEEDGEAVELIAADVTGLVRSDASYREVEMVIQTVDSADLERFIARTFDRPHLHVSRLVRPPPGAER